ncbi:hypothetical protein JCM5350_008176 [Sporobolomyces pararoseus]
MSFSSLPPELVHQIIESTVPHTFHSTTYHERQRTLCRLSLVSKLFRSIAQPLLLEIVYLDRLEDAEKLQGTRALEGGARFHQGPRSLVIDLDGWEDLGRTQVEEDRFLESLRVFETIGGLTAASIEDERHFTHLLSMNSSLDPSTAPNLRNFALVDCSQHSAQWLKTPSISRFLLQLETLYFDSYTWSQLDEGFRRSVASRTSVDVRYGMETASHSKASVIHARVDGLSFNTILSGEQVAKKVDLCASFIEDFSSLKSLYLDSSFRSSSRLPVLIRSSAENLARICRERKIDLIFDQIPMDDELDPLISAEFIRRQKFSREIGA